MPFKTKRGSYDEVDMRMLEQNHVDFFCILSEKVTLTRSSTKGGNMYVCCSLLVHPPMVTPGKFPNPLFIFP